MKIVRFFDSCVVAAYKTSNDENRGVSNALGIIFAALMFYWVDVVIALDYARVLSNLGWTMKEVDFIGGACIGLAVVFFYMPHAEKIVNDSSLGSSQYRFQRYVFFCSPVIIFFALILLSIRFPRS